MGSVQTKMEVSNGGQSTPRSKPQACKVSENNEPVLLQTSLPLPAVVAYFSFIHFRTIIPSSLL